MPVLLLDVCVFKFCSNVSVRPPPASPPSSQPILVFGHMLGRSVSRTWKHHPQLEHHPHGGVIPKGASSPSERHPQGSIIPNGTSCPMEHLPHVSFFAEEASSRGASSPGAHHPQHSQANIIVGGSRPTSARPTQSAVAYGWVTGGSRCVLARSTHVHTARV